MQDSTSKEKILKRVRKALINKSSYEPTDVDFETEMYSGTEEPYEFQFAQNFTALNGKFFFCEDEKDFVSTLVNLINESDWKQIFCFEPKINSIISDSLPVNNKVKEISNVDVGITTCECLIARTGSVMITSRQASGRRLPLFSNIHIVVAYTSQIVYNLKDGLKLIKKKYEGNVPSMITNISGPSRTADIEKTLVQGAHGPKEIFVFLIEDVVVTT
jgi:L-lactate dehydrogenase complex protein LldG